MPAPKRKVRYAVAGLGSISQVALLPAFDHAGNSQIAALISEDPVKQKSLSKKYGAPAYGYEQFEQALQQNEIDAVYIGVPNSMHREYTVRAAAVGVHVLCEKPMANTEKDCAAMIRACRDHGVKLMIAYRLHFNDANLQAVKIVESGKLGDLRFFSSSFGQQVVAGNIRLRKELGGGTLFDLGVYAINAARYLFRDEPNEAIAVTATKGENRFSEVEEMTSAILRFPGERLAAFTVSFGSAVIGEYELVGTQGTLRLNPAYDYSDEMKWELKIGNKKQEKTFAAGDQFAAELIYFSNCILKNEDPEPSGEEGLADVRIVNALYKSARTGKPVRIEAIPPKPRPEPSQEIKRPPTKPPKQIDAKLPSGEV